jgi:dihydroorotase
MMVALDNISDGVFYCHIFCSPVARCENDTAVLAHTVICNEREVAEGFFTIFNALHPGGYVYNAEVEINLYVVNVSLAVKV